MNKQDVTNSLANVRVILSHTSHPGNIGSAARAMKTMGLEQLYLINPVRFPDKQADIMAVSAVDVVKNAVVCSSLDEALAGTVLVAGISARIRDVSQEVLTPREAMPQIVQQAMHAPVALLFGTEMSGLTNEELVRCQFMVSIPANPDYSSLNLASAVQLISYELRLAAGLGNISAPELLPAPAEELERYFVHLEQTLGEIGFLRTHQTTKLMYKLRRLYARARLEQDEVNILRGILTASTEYHIRQKQKSNT
ncbi:MAG: RNA methyltransferase [Gallionellaceae bacterium]